MLKEQRGITLIALVITIIVLIILAGVSIAMLSGDNGIMTKANEAVTETNRAEIVERINIELNAALIDAYQGKTTFSAEELTAIGLRAKGTATFETNVLTVTGTGDYSTISGTLNVSTKVLDLAQ